MKNDTTETTKHRWKKLKKAQTNVKISCVDGSEELILLKWPYYPKPSIDSMLSLSKSQWHISKKLKNNNPKMYMETCFESPLAEEFKSKLEINEGSLKTFENSVVMRLISTIKCKKRYSVK